MCRLGKPRITKEKPRDERRRNNLKKVWKDNKKRKILDVYPNDRGQQRGEMPFRDQEGN